MLGVLLQMKWLVSAPTSKIFGTQWIPLVMAWAAEDESHQILGFGEHFKIYRISSMLFNSLRVVATLQAYLHAPLRAIASMPAQLSSTYNQSRIFFLPLQADNNLLAIWISCFTPVWVRGRSWVPSLLLSVILSIRIALAVKCTL